MAIYERERDFYKLFSEIDVDVIPIKFVHEITCFLNDGTKVTLNSDNMSKFNHKLSTDVDNLIKELTFYEMLTDLQISINFDQVEKDVDNEVARILKN